MNLLAMVHTHLFCGGTALPLHLLFCSPGPNGRRPTQALALHSSAAREAGATASQGSMSGDYQSQVPLVQSAAKIPPGLCLGSG